MSLQLLYHSIRHERVHSGLTFGCMWIFHRGMGDGQVFMQSSRRKRQKKEKNLNPTEQ